MVSRALYGARWASLRAHTGRSGGGLLQAPARASEYAAMSTRQLADEHDSDGDPSEGFTPAKLLDAGDLEQSLLDVLHALKYGEEPRGLGWAWNKAEEVALSPVHINGTAYTFNPIT